MSCNDRPAFGYPTADALRLWKTAEQSVPLVGVAQIPEDLRHALAEEDCRPLRDDQVRRLLAVIWDEAAPEIRRRHEAKLARVHHESYVSTRDDEED
jgi:hypothetical protein